MVDYTDLAAFAEVYSLTTGRKQTVPRLWLDDPILGRDFRKTPSQRETDGDLPPRPHESDAVKVIDAYADAAGIDLAGASTKPEKVATIDAVFARDDTQEGLDPIIPAVPVPDPLVPELVAHRDQPPLIPAQSSAETAEQPLDDTTDVGDNAGDQSDQEN